MTFNRILITITAIQIVMIILILANRSEREKIQCIEWEHLVYNYSSDYSCLKDIIDIK